MTTATLTSLVVRNQSGSDQPDQPDNRRITEADPDFVKLKAKTASKLMASLRQYVADLRRDGAQGADRAASQFIQRQLTIMRDAYLAAYAEGQKDYWQSVSNKPHPTAPMTPRQIALMRDRLMWYGAASVTKMAREALSAYHAEQVANLPTTKTFADASGPDALNQWTSGVGARITLQADLTWGAMQDGYADAGAGDVGSPYTQLWWVLEPGAQHCGDCPDMAAGSPYDPPGSGGNELDQTPGDGRTECGAACKCDLSYEPPDPENWVSWSDIFPPDMPQMQQVAPQSSSVAGQPGKRVGPTGGAHGSGGSTSGEEPTYSRSVLQPQPTAKDAPLTTDQKAALDAFRIAWAAWDAVRGAYPAVPSLFASTGDAEGAMESLSPQSWDDLTPQQQRAYVALFEALVAWDAATKAANNRGGQQMAEPQDEAIVRLFNPNHYGPGPQGGEFAPAGGGVGESEAPKGKAGGRGKAGGANKAPRAAAKVANGGATKAPRVRAARGGGGGASVAGKAERPRAAPKTVNVKPQMRKEAAAEKAALRAQQQAEKAAVRERVRVEKEQAAAQRAHAQQEKLAGLRAKEAEAKAELDRATVTRDAARAAYQTRVDHYIAEHSGDINAAFKALRKDPEAKRLDVERFNAEKAEMKAMAAHMKAKDAADKADPVVRAQREAAHAAWQKQIDEWNQHAASREAAWQQQRAAAQAAQAARDAEMDKQRAQWGKENARHEAARQAKIAELHAKDSAVVRAENGQWTGDAALHPPFSVSEFEHADLTPLGYNEAGINASQSGTIGGKKYLIKEVTEDTSFGSTEKIPNAPRFSTHAEAASTKIAEEMGMGDHVVPTYAFEQNGHQYVAVEWRDLNRASAGGLASDAMAKAVPQAKLTDMVLHEYVVGEPDRHGGNYLLNRETGEVYEIDHGFSLYTNRTNVNENAESYWALHKANANAAFDVGQLRRIVDAEPRIIQTMRQYHLDAGIRGARQRIKVLRDLANMAHPTVDDLVKLGKQRDKTKGE